MPPTDNKGCREKVGLVGEVVNAGGGQTKQNLPTGQEGKIKRKRNEEERKGKKRRKKKGREKLPSMTQVMILTETPSVMSRPSCRQACHNMMAFRLWNPPVHHCQWYIKRCKMA